MVGCEFGMIVVKVISALSSREIAMISMLCFHFLAIANFETRVLGRQARVGPVGPPLVFPHNMKLLW